MSALSVLFPAYIYPTSTAWAPLTSCIAQNPANTFNIVINPASGPGSSQYPNTDYITAISNLNSYANVQTFGYVNTAYGTRLSTAVDNDISIYAGWSNYTSADIAMDGIFFDATPNLNTPVSNVFMNSISSMAKQDGFKVYFNPGGAMDQSFYSLADYVNAIEISGVFYTSGIVSAVPAADRYMSSALIYSFLGTSSDQSQIMYNFANAGLGGVYVSTAPFFNAFGTQWSNFCAALNQTVVTSSSSSSSIASSSIASTSSSSASSVAATSIPASSSASSSSASSSSAAPASSTATTAKSSSASTSSTSTSASTSAVTSSTSTKASSTSTVAAATTTSKSGFSFPISISI